MESKEKAVLKLFFDTPKHWHFDKLKKAADIGRPQLARWLKVFEKQGIIKRVKQKGKMPYYIHDFGNPGFKNRKRLFAWKNMMDVGLLNHLCSLVKAKVVILFGSFTRSDWSKNSDVDIFIYGKDDDFKQAKYESKIKRNIQVHKAVNTKDLKKMNKLLPYILSGNFIKGSVQDLGIKIHAKV